MQSRKGCWRTPLLVLTAALLALVPLVTLADAQNQTVLRQQQPRSSEDGPGIREAFTPPEAAPLKKPVLYPRTEGFWTFGSGPDYGRVPSNLAMSPDVLITRVGSFVTKGNGLAIPDALRAPEAPVGSAYYMVQFTPAAFAPGHVDQSLRELQSLGATLVEYIPNNGYIVKLDPASYGPVSSSPLVQYTGRFHPAYKISPSIGTAPLPDAAKAASPIYSLVLRGWPGSTAAEIAAQVTALGGTVTYSTDDESGAWVLADLHKGSISSLAAVEAVRSIDENLPRFAYGEESSWNVVAGTYIIGVKPSIYLAGVNGSGGFLKDLDNAPTGNFPGAEDKDWNGNGVIDNAAQVIADIDTGMAVDAGDFSETATSSGWNGFGGNAGPNVPRIGNAGGTGANGGANHRKIAWYEVAPGGFGTGDLKSCDPAASHGTVTSGQACGNASSGPFASDNVDWTGDGVADDYGDPVGGDLCGPGFCFTSGTQVFRVDGVAPGARIVFQDVNSTCPEPESFTFGAYSTILGDARTKGARLQTFSFGAFNVALGTTVRRLLEGDRRLPLDRCQPRLHDVRRRGQQRLLDRDGGPVRQGQHAVERGGREERRRRRSEFLGQLRRPAEPLRLLLASGPPRTGSTPPAPRAACRPARLPPATAAA